MHIHGKRNTTRNKNVLNANVRTAFTTNNNLAKLLNLRDDQKPDKYDNNGVYQLKCPTCQKKYTGQTGRPFRVRFHEHYNDYKYKNNKSKFAQHIIGEGHAFGPMIDIMDIVHIEKKGRMLNTLEKYHIYRETYNGNQINEKLTVQKNPIFEALIQHNPHRGQHT